MAKKSNNKIKDEITLKYLSDDFVGLNRNGADLFCPFVPPIVFQQTVQVTNSKPQIGHSRSTCTSLCPLFKIIEGGKSVRLNCGNSVEYNIDKIVTIEETIKKIEGTVIKMDKNIN